MGRALLIIVLAAVLGGSYLTLNSLSARNETLGRRSNAQATMLARQISESGMAIALSEVTHHDGFSNDGLFPSERDYNDGTIRFESYDDTLTPSTPNGQRISVRVSGEFGGATHRLASVYELDPMDFPGPVWLDVPHAVAAVHANAELSGGDFGYTPQVDPQKYNDLEISEFGFTLDGVRAAFAGASDVVAPGASLPAWDMGGTTNDGKGRTADLGAGVTTADGLYYALHNAVDTGAGDQVVAGGLTVSGSQTLGTSPQSITRIEGPLTVGPGARLAGEGALLVEGDLVVRGRLDWDGLVVIRTEADHLTVDLTGPTTIDGALVVAQEAYPPGGHSDLTVFRQPDGNWTKAWGRREAGPGALHATPRGLTPEWPFWNHIHKFDHPTPGDVDYTNRRRGEIHLVDDDAGDPQESYTGLRELLDHLGSTPVQVEFANVGANGQSIIEVEVDGETPMQRGLNLGFAGTDLQGATRYRSKTFPAEDLERLVIRPQSLRSFQKLWDSAGVCSESPVPEWPVCVGLHRNDREGALTVRIRRASGGVALYEAAVYWHMQVGPEEAQYQAELDAWRTGVSDGSIPFGTDLTMGPNTVITYELGPVVSLAEKVGFDGNEVIHVSTESALVEVAGRGPSAPDPAPAPPPPPPTNPLDTSGGGNATVCHSGSPLTIPRLEIMAHVLHNDTVGGCPDTPPSSAFDDIVVCHSGSSVAVNMTAYATHVSHGDTYGSCTPP